ncbi:MAG: hypothetical protein JO295_05770 [Verrucomicrobia bacterium]|nr:hypothetical protein [Verrucomicrobiota bacterium]
MAIPEELKKFLTLDKAEKHLDLVSGLVDPEKKGNIISLAALAEEELTKFLTRYYAAQNRSEDFQELIENSLTFHDKIEAVKKVIPKLDSTEANYKPHFEFLRALKRLRNTAAHSYSVGIDEATKLAGDSEAIHLVSDFPNNLWARVKALRDYLAGVNR